MGQKQQTMAYDSAQSKRRGGLASPIKQSGSGCATDIKIGNALQNGFPSGEIKVGNHPHKSSSRSKPQYFGNPQEQK